MTPDASMIRWVIDARDTVSSTMDEAALLVLSGADEGTVVVANRQTAGRGRAGRAWENPIEALQATIILRPSLPPARLTLAPLLFGLAAAEAIEERCPAVRVWLKWPNDLWIGDRIGGRKVGGILVEMKAGGAMLAGIGINLGADDGRDVGLPDGAAILRSAGCDVDSRSLLDALLVRIAAHWGALMAGDGRVPLEGWLSRAALLGERVTMLRQEEPITGRFAGLREDGALLLEDAAGTTHVMIAGDLTRGPRRITE
jgi:BirA family biotin operon repressor/biotin-[acetyl-CoA-carboxylase] ligase